MNDEITADFEIILMDRGVDVAFNGQTFKAVFHYNDSSPSDTVYERSEFLKKGTLKSFRSSLDTIPEVGDYLISDGIGMKVTGRYLRPHNPILTLEVEYDD